MRRVLDLSAGAAEIVKQALTAIEDCKCRCQDERAIFEMVHLIALVEGFRCRYDLYCLYYLLQTQMSLSGHDWLLNLETGQLFSKEADADYELLMSASGFVVQGRLSLQGREVHVFKIGVGSRELLDLLEGKVDEKQRATVESLMQADPRVLAASATYAFLHYDYDLAGLACQPGTDEVELMLERWFQKEDIEAAAELLWSIGCRP